MSEVAKKDVDADADDDDKCTMRRRRRRAGKMRTVSEEEALCFANLLPAS